MIELTLNLVLGDDLAGVVGGNDLVINQCRSCDGSSEVLRSSAARDDACYRRVNSYTLLAANVLSIEDSPERGSSWAKPLSLGQN